MIRKGVYIGGLWNLHTRKDFSINFQFSGIASSRDRDDAGNFGQCGEYNNFGHKRQVADP